MCGIAGFTHYTCKPDEDRIWEATLSLSHRGPDHQAIFRSELISLGAVRLRIVDLDGGDQPLQSDNTDCTVVFNGEIFNNTELRQELLSRGRKFKTRCDTETVLQAFEEWDLECLPKLRGMFAFAIWSQSRHRLVLARDRLGIKPLYYHQRGQDLYFGSELKAILAHPEIDRSLCAEGLHYYTSLNYVPSPLTLIEGIRKLSPAHWMEWRDGKVRTGRYWQLNMQPDGRLTEASASEELDGLLRGAIREQLAADVPVGIWASGGLDSSTVLHYASQYSARRLNTFSVSFKGRKFDDGEYARQVARYYGAEHHELDLNPSLDLPSAIEDMAYYSDEPGADAGALPVWFLSQMTREHVTVALSGEGADELFGGYYTYLADQYARPLRLIPSLARRAALQVARTLPVSDEKIGLDYKVQRMLSGSLLSPADAHFYWNGTFSEAEKKKLHLRNGFQPVGSLMSNLQAAPNGAFNRYLLLDQNYYLPDNILYKCDRMSMAHALEVRPPFLDHRIVEFAARLPEQMKIRRGALKWLLRRLMSDKLPQNILTRKKEGFDIPAHEWLRGPLRPLLLDTLNKNAVLQSDVFHWKHVQSLLETHQQRRANLGYHLWGLLTLFLWIRRWDIQPSRVCRSQEELSPVSALG